MFEKIQIIPIQNVLDRLSIKYQSIGSGILGIIEDGKLSNGWRVNVIGNFVRDFSKNRAQGPPRSFVKTYLNLTNQETFKFFADNFNIRSELKRPKNKGSPQNKKKNRFEPYSRKRLTE